MTTPIDDGVDVMLAAGVEFGQMLEFVQLAVDPHADEAGLADLGQHLLLLAPSAADQRRQDHHLACLRAAASSVSWICSAICCWIGSPHCGQDGSPSRAISSRR